MALPGRCDQCIYYRQHATHHTHGACLRFPPQVDGKFWEMRHETNKARNPNAQRNYPGRGIWPLVKGTETCGEFAEIADGGGGDVPADPDPIGPDEPLEVDAG